jgi:hypothetical protein
MAPPLPGPAAPARNAGRVLLKVLVVILAGAAALVASVVASVLGLSLLLVLGAVGALMSLKVRQRAQAGYSPHRSRKVLLATGLAIVGFFVVISVVAAYWPR